MDIESFIETVVINNFKVVDVKNIINKHIDFCCYILDAEGNDNFIFTH